MGVIQEQDIVEWLVKECHEVANRITSYLLVGERVLVIGWGVLTVAITIAVSQDQSQFLMGLPFVYCLLLIYLSYLNTEAVSLGGYKAAIELEIVRRVGFPVVSWESQIARQRHWDIAGASVRLLGLILLLGSIVVALIQALATRSPNHWGHADSPLYIGGTIGSIAVGLVLVIASFVAEVLAHRRVETITRNLMLKYRVVQNGADSVVPRTIPEAPSNQPPGSDE
jgi:hypothetical protein